MGGLSFSLRSLLYLIPISFILVTLLSKQSAANYIGSPIKVATSLVIEENKIENYLDRTSRTSTPSTTTTTTTTSTTATTTTSFKATVLSRPPETNLATQIVVLNSFSENREKQFSEIVNDVLAAQSEPIDLIVSSSSNVESEMQDVDRKEDNFVERTEFIRTSSVYPFETKQQQQQHQQQQLHHDSFSTSTQMPYKTTYMPFKPTGSPLKTSTNWNLQDVSNQNQNLANSGQSYPEISSTSKPLVSGSWSLITTPKPVFGENSKPIYAGLSLTVFEPEETKNSQNAVDAPMSSFYANPSASSYASPTSASYAEISSTSKTDQVLASGPWPTVNSKPHYFKPEYSGFQETFSDLKPTQNVDPTLDPPVGFPQYDPSSVTQIPNVESEDQSSLVTPINYKPTFKPFIPEVNETQFAVDNTFLIDELEGAEGVTEVVPTLVGSSENDTIAILATMLAEKFDMEQMSESATKYINQVK